jgi:hypothetical protein
MVHIWITSFIGTCIVGEENQIGARAAVAMVLKSRLVKGAQKSNWGNTHFINIRYYMQQMILILLSALKVY